MCVFGVVVSLGGFGVLVGGFYVFILVCFDCLCFSVVFFFKFVL